MELWGIINKDRDFWKFIEKYDFISLSETWLENKGWENFEKKLSRDFIWKCIGAVRRNKKGRAKGGFVLGIRKTWVNNMKYWKLIEGKNMVISRLREKKGYLERLVSL